MLDNMFGEKSFPNIETKPPLAQLEIASPYPITCCAGTDTCFATASFQAAVECDKVSPLSPLFSRLNKPTSLSCPS